ncbi:MAG: response regulator transcription factor [Bacteroidota bacterium]
MSTSKKIIIVEDDLNLGFLLLDFLEAEGYRVKLCRDGQMGLRALEKDSYDLCILDVMMPEMDGFAFARQLKSRGYQLPFLFLTARSMKEDRLQGYALGAEDYIAKPFDEDELLCKIEVVLRHTTAEVETCPEQFTLGDYYFDYARQELHFNGQCQRITQKENEVLRLLCLHKGQILRREEAVEQIYGKKDYFLGRSFDVFISRLRKLLKRDPKISIENVFRVGFILNVEE